MFPILVFYCNLYVFEIPGVIENAARALEGVTGEISLFFDPERKKVEATLPQPVPQPNIRFFTQIRKDLLCSAKVGKKVLNHIN